MTMDDFEVYRYYLALKLHFTTDKYDVIKSRGRVTATREAYNKRKNLYVMKKLARKLDDKEVVHFFVANFVSGDKFGGVYSDKSDQTFKEWQRKVESLSYMFKKDISYLQEQCDRLQKEFSYIFVVERNEHPILLKEYLGKSINLETLVVLNNINSFVDTFDNLMYNDIIWKDVSRTIKKYTPFLRYDKKKFKDEYDSRF